MVEGSVEIMAMGPYMSEDTIIILMALLCALISVVGFASVFPWRCFRRSPEEVAAWRANSGIKPAAMEALMPAIIFCKAGWPVLQTDCPICLAEFVQGETMRVLPKCNHCFHLGCIDKWFRSHSSCPTCRQCLLDISCKQPAGAAAPLRTNYKHTNPTSGEQRDHVLHHKVEFHDVEAASHLCLQEPFITVQGE